MKKYEFLEHTADIKFRAWGKNVPEVFENSILAFSDLISRKNRVSSKIVKDIRIEGGDLENLMYKFIEELIYLLDAEDFVVSKAELEFIEGIISGKLYGDRSGNYEGLDHVKAVTYAEMYVKKVKGFWEAQVVLDV